MSPKLLSILGLLPAMCPTIIIIYGSIVQNTNLLYVGRQFVLQHSVEGEVDAG
jgi:hypothetical protein